MNSCELVGLWPELVLGRDVGLGPDEGEEVRKAEDGSGPVAITPRRIRVAAFALIMWSRLGPWNSEECG